MKKSYLQKLFKEMLMPQLKPIIEKYEQIAQQEPNTKEAKQMKAIIDFMKQHIDKNIPEYAPLFNLLYEFVVETDRNPAFRKQVIDLIMKIYEYDLEEEE